MRKFGLILKLVMLGVFLLPTAFGAGFYSPKELLEEARKGRVEYLKAVSEVQGKVAYLGSKEELYPYLEILDELLVIEVGYDAETFGRSPAKLLGFAVTEAAYKWVLVDRDPPKLIETFLKYSSDKTKFSMAHMQSLAIAQVTNFTDLVKWVDQLSVVLVSVKSIKTEPYVLAAFEDAQAAALRVALKNSANLTNVQLEAILSRSTATASLVEASAYLKAKASAAATVEDVLAVMTLAKAYDRAAKQNQGAPIYLKVAAGEIISDSLQKLINLKGGSIARAEVYTAVEVLTAATTSNIASLLVALGDRLMVKEQLGFLTDLANAIADRLEFFGMYQQKYAMDNLVARLIAFKRLQENDFEGLYEAKFAEHTGTIALFHTGGGRFAGTVSFLFSGGIDTSLSMFYFSFDSATNTMRSTQHPFENSEFPRRMDIHADLIFQFIPGTNCIKGNYGYPAGNESFTACRIMTAPKFDQVVETLPPKLDFSGLFQGKCGIYDIEMRMIHVGGRLTMNWFNIDAWLSFPHHFGVTNPGAHSAILTSGEITAVGRFFQTRIRYIDEDTVEVWHFVTGNSYSCTGTFKRAIRQIP